MAVTGTHAPTYSNPYASATSAAAGHAGAAAHGAHGAGAAHIEPRAPRSGDSRFIQGSVGEFGQSQTIQQRNGPAYGGRDVAKEQNDNDREQNNYGVTDANFTRTLGVIADPNTGQPMSYAQTMQAYNAAGAVQMMAPDVYAKLVANQNAGRGTVLGGALAILGITKTDGAGGASLAGIDQNRIAQVSSMQLPGLGSLRDYVLDTRDFKGREWNRAHHTGSSWLSMTGLVQSGYSWPGAALATGDSMTSWSGRVLGSNNQDGSETGFAADELAGLKYVALMERATGKPALEQILGSHSNTHLPEDKLTDPKINKLIGLPEGFRPQTPEQINMVADRLRTWVLQPGVQVDQGEFQKFVEAGGKTAEGQQLQASGLLSTVQFEPKRDHGGGHGGGGGGNDAAKDAAVQPTGLGTNPAAAGAVGGGEIAPAGVPGSPTIDTRPTLEQLGAGGPFPVIDPATKKLNKSLQDQLMTALVENLRRVNDNAWLGDDEEDAAFDEGQRAGERFVKVATARDPEAVDQVKASARAAMEDEQVTQEEQAELSQQLGDAGLDDLAASVKDGKLEGEDLERAAATFEEKVDGAVAAQLEKDVTSALEDGDFSDEERTGLEPRVDRRSLGKMDTAVEDGEVTKAELDDISTSVREGATQRKAERDARGARRTAGGDSDADGTEGGGAGATNRSRGDGGERSEAASAAPSKRATAARGARDD